MSHLFNYLMSNKTNFIHVHNSINCFCNMKCYLKLNLICLNTVQGSLWDILLLVFYEKHHLRFLDQYFNNYNSYCYYNNILIITMLIMELQIMVVTG